MKSPKVHLYIRVLTAAGRSVFAEPVWNKNHTLKAGYAAVDSKHHPEGIYYIRFGRNGKPAWQAVGRETDAAIMALRKTEHTLQAACLGLEVVTPSPASAVVTLPASPVASPFASPSLPPGSPRTLLDEAIRVYLIDLKRFRAPGTVNGATYMLTRFGGRFPGRFVNDIDRRDLLDHIDFLKSEDGLGDTTISNHLTRIGALLRTHGVVGLLSATEKPTPDEKEVEAYEADEMECFFSAADPEELITFQFFLATGLREKEVAFTSWRNIDIFNRWVTVRSKPEMGFRIKDKQERSVPVPDALISALVERRKGSSSMLVFPGKDGQPNGHFLRMVQTIAYRAGLNCGECVTKAGKCCAGHPVCCQWGLHKFRKTFATMHHEAGVPARTIQRWLGHTDLTSTLRYLASAKLKSSRTRNQVNATFAAPTWEAQHDGASDPGQGSRPSDRADARLPKHPAPRRGSLPPPELENGQDRRIIFSFLPK